MNNLMVQLQLTVIAVRLDFSIALGAMLGLW
jgi:hypothetical protein